MTGNSILIPPGPRMRRTRQSPRFAPLVARVISRRIDGELAAGALSWASPVHAARALQLTSRRNRLTLARSLERLLRDARRPRPSYCTAVVAACRPQVREARGTIRELASRLRSDEPLDARGAASLTLLLTDGGGPCYAEGQQSLVSALEEVSEWLEALD